MKTKNTPWCRKGTKTIRGALAAIALLHGIHASAQNNTGQTFFEIDGNYQVTTAGRTDWSSVVPTTPGQVRYISATEGSYWGVDQNWGVNSPSRGDTSQFGCCANKNGDDIGPTTGNWTWNGIGQEPQKNDLTNIFLYWKVLNGRVYLFGAAETRATNGDSHVDFEYNQAGLTVTGTGSGLLKGNGPSRGRTNGDFIISVDYVNGGTVPLFTLREWRNGNWSQPSPLNNQNNLNVRADATFNSVTVPAIFPNRGFDTDGAVSGNVVPLQHFEFVVTSPVIDATWPTIGTNPAICNTAATFRFATRSSQSFNAELKDLALASIAFGPPPPFTIPSLEQCYSSQGNAFSLTPSIACNSAYTYAWTFDPALSGFTSGSFNTASSCPTTANLLSNDQYNRRVANVKLTISSGICSRSATGTLTILPQPKCDITANPNPPAQGICPDNSTITFSIDPNLNDANATWSIQNFNGAEASIITNPATGYSVQVRVGRKCGYFKIKVRSFRGVICGPADCEKRVDLVDIVPPVITCGANGTFDCTQTQPPFTPPTVSDNCTPTNLLVVTFTDLPPVVSNGATTYTRVYRVTDLCNNAATCSQSFTQNPCNSFCSYTQGAYGNAGGVHCNGQTTPAFLATLLATPLTVGVNPTRFITFTSADVNCIIAKLPGGGNAAALSGTTNCAGITPLNNGKIYNSLLAQTLTMSLNLRIPGNQLADLRLTGRFLSTASTSGSNCTSSGSAVGGGSVFTLPANVISFLGTNNKVSDLVALANRALAGTYTGSNPSLTDIMSAIDVLNNAFDGCRALVSISNTAPTVRMMQQNPTDSPTISEFVKAFPNPFTSKTTIRMTAPVSAHADIVVYDVQGKVVASLYSGQVEEGTDYSFVFDGSQLPAGIYIYRINAGDFRNTGRVSLTK